MSTPTKPARHTPYSPAEREYLRANYATASMEEIMAAVPGRSWRVIRCAASKMGVSGRPAGSAGSATTPWAPANKAILRELYPQPDGVNLVMAALGMGRLAVQGAAARLGLKCGPRVRHPRPAVPKTPRAVAVKVAVVKVARPVAVKVAAPARARVTPKKAAKIPRCYTPNANAGKLERQRSAVKPPITADQIRKLDYNHPARVAYTNGGIAGWVGYMKAQA